MASAEPTTSAQLPLPMEVLVHVLQQVTLQQRLGACALVSRTWRTAANTATTSIALATSDQARATGMTDWIPKRSRQLATLSVEGRVVKRLHLALPCLHLTQLEELSLDFVKLQTQPGTTSSGTAAANEASSGSGAAADSSSGQLQQLVRLTSLLLDNCQLQLQDLHGLAALTKLRQLQLHTVQCPDIQEESDYEQQLDSTIGAALSHLVQLTQLCITDQYMTEPALVHISRLQQLRELKLHFEEVQPLSLPPLPSSLTCFELESAMLTPGVLSGCVQLRHLSLEHCQHTGSDGGTVLLAALASMTQLQHLELIDSVPLASAAAYAALTASSQLTHLRVTDTDGEALPVGAGKLMFAAGRQLPCLQAVHLEFGVSDAEEEVAAAGVAAADADGIVHAVNAAAMQQQVCQQDIDSLFRACSGLRKLNLKYDGPTTWASHVQLQLHGLLASKSSLTSLTLNRSQFGLLRVGDEEVQHVLSQLTGLQELILDRPEGLTYAGLLHLTQLRQLRLLHIANWAADASSTLYYHHLFCKAPTPPDVWQQLQELCESKSLG